MSARELDGAVDARVMNEFVEMLLIGAAIELLDRRGGPNDLSWAEWFAALEVSRRAY